MRFQALVDKQRFMRYAQVKWAFPSKAVTQNVLILMRREPYITIFPAYPVSSK